MNIGDPKYTVFKTFADFCIKHQILDDYVYNLSKEPDLTEGTIPYGFFQCAFSWSTTSKGNNFWDALDDQWLELVDGIDPNLHVTFQEILDFLTSPSPIEPQSPQFYEYW